MSEFSQISLDLPRLGSHGIATITLDRPEKLNAFTNVMVRELIAAFDITDGNDAVRSVIVTGAGRAFCAGADVSRGAETFKTDADNDQVATGGATRVPRDGGGQVTTRIFQSIKPVIAAINGPAVGVGITMTLPMDIRLATPDAKIGFVFTRRGLAPEAASSWFLPRIVGISKALEWCYSGRIFPGTEACEAGLVQSIHEHDELLPAARALAASFADGTSAVSVATTRQMLWRMLGADHPMEAHKVDSRMIAELGKGADVAEGVTSFLERRPPKFFGKPSTDLPPSIPWWEERPFA
ncbi:MAG: crotonase/enoyl-CoA hydratase family protein [Actinomycetota bacterium]|nr:crotonase/enoyl-CoA hydratase family protein [Actinomycetota bacterium]